MSFDFLAQPYDGGTYSFGFVDSGQSPKPGMIAYVERMGPVGYQLSVNNLGGGTFGTLGVIVGVSDDELANKKRVTVITDGTITLKNLQCVSPTTTLAVGNSITWTEDGVVSIKQDSPRFCVLSKTTNTVRIQLIYL